MEDTIEAMNNEYTNECARIAHKEFQIIKLKEEIEAHWKSVKFIDAKVAAKKMLQSEEAKTNE